MNKKLLELLQRMTPAFLLTPLLLVGCTDVPQEGKVYRSPYPAQVADMGRPDRGIEARP